MAYYSSPPAGEVLEFIKNKGRIPISSDKIERFRVPFNRDVWTLNDSSQNWQLAAYQADALNASYGHNSFETVEWNLWWCREYLRRQLTTPMGFMSTETDSIIYDWIFVLPIRTIRALAIRHEDAETLSWCDKWFKIWLLHQSFFYSPFTTMRASEERMSSFQRIGGELVCDVKNPIEQNYSLQAVGMRSFSSDVGDVDRSAGSRLQLFRFWALGASPDGVSKEFNTFGFNSGCGIQPEERTAIQDFIGNNTEANAKKLIETLGGGAVKSAYPINISYRTKGKVCWMSKAASHSTEPLTFHGVYDVGGVQKAQLIVHPTGFARQQKHSLSILETKISWEMQSTIEDFSISKLRFGEELFKVVWDGSGHRVESWNSIPEVVNEISIQECIKKSDGKKGIGSSSILSANFLSPCNLDGVWIVAKGGGSQPWSTESFIIDDKGNLRLTCESTYDSSGNLVCYRTFWDEKGRPGFFWLPESVTLGVTREFIASGYTVFHNVSGGSANLPLHVKPYPLIQYTKIQTTVASKLEGGFIVKEDLMDKNKEVYKFICDQSGMLPYAVWESYVNGELMQRAENSTVYARQFPYTAMCLMKDKQMRWGYTSDFTPKPIHSEVKPAILPKIEDDRGFFEKLFKGGFCGD